MSTLSIFRQILIDTDVNIILKVVLLIMSMTAVGRPLLMSLYG